MCLEKTDTAQVSATSDARLSVSETTTTSTKVTAVNSKYIIIATKVMC